MIADCFPLSFDEWILWLMTLFSGKFNDWNDGSTGSERKSDNDDGRLSERFQERAVDGVRTEGGLCGQEMCG
jgi:hypothetical protein